jgi:P-type Ca2+ transporter type 2C
MMTFFNFINARKLDDQFNVVKGIFSSPFFIPILGIILFLQAVILTFTGVAFRVAPWVSLIYLASFN